MEIQNKLFRAAVSPGLRGVSKGTKEMTRETVFISRIDFLHASAMVDISCTACRDLSKLNQDHWISASEPASTSHTNEARFSPLN